MKFLDHNDKLIDTRFDLSIYRAFTQSPNVRDTYETIRRDCLSGTLTKHVKLNEIFPELAITDEDARLAELACLDYHFERYVLPTMTPMQAEQYMHSVRQAFTFSIDAHGVSGQPILIEAAHHQSIFSILYYICTQIFSRHGYKKVIMIHQDPRVDPRLNVQIQVAKLFHDIDFELICVTESLGWFRKIKKSVTHQSIILYLGDMPNSFFLGEGNKEQECYLSLGLRGSKGAMISRFSIAEKLSKRLTAAHYLCNITHQGVHLTNADSSKPLHCPLTSWVFWPAINHLYK